MSTPCQLSTSSTDQAIDLGSIVNRDIVTGKFKYKKVNIIFDDCDTSSGNILWIEFGADDINPLDNGFAIKGYKSISLKIKDKR
ncbi:hypothetical protein EQ875_01529 [Photobacterium damselae subsp. damselae]|uniref:hypothetical protein n=1 Tax=Photobacterium damselae TaxID=38293 RepID=UPI00109BDA32|nr:hypothetical protein [Photobacterium damselae]TGZ35250.1 hypothetical protein EQ875_01529 [Photobacterium damselae subsp. damselae]